MSECPEPWWTNAALGAYFAPGPQVRHAAVRRGPRAATSILMEHVLGVLGCFSGSMSTRQVYYQLVSRGAVSNCDRSYEKVQRLLVHMRRDGLVGYDRIVDRNRARHQLPGWEGVREMMTAVQLQFRRDAWNEQDTVVMVALEKAALEGIFAEACDEYGAQLWTIRGFNSESFAYEWAQEILRLEGQGKSVVVRYFGDFDPSGVALEHDAKEKLARHGAVFDWERRGLLFGDFDAFDLVRVPVKATDSRSARFVRAFGDCAAELDALDPGELRVRISDCIVEWINEAAWLQVRRTEEVERESLALVSANWDAALAGARSAA